MHSKAFCFQAVIVSICVYMCDHTLEVCEHDILLTACGNFAKFGHKDELIRS